MNLFNRKLFGTVVMLLVLEFSACDISETYRPTHERDELAEAEGICLARLLTPAFPGKEAEREMDAFLICVLVPQSIRDSYD